MCSLINKLLNCFALIMPEVSSRKGWTQILSARQTWCSRHQCHVSPRVPSFECACSSAVS